MRGDEELEAMLLEKLVRMRCWGAHHICESNLQKKFAKHERGRVMEIAERLRREGLLVKRPSSHEHQWFLNIARRGEIEGRIRGRPSSP